MCTHTRLFVGNLPDNAKEKDVHNAFSSYGEVVNLDLKTKTADESSKKNFAFVTLSADNHDVEACIKHFSHHEFKGHMLYVTRARESFLERLQRERDQLQRALEAKKDGDHIQLPKKNPTLKLGDKLNPRKRRLENTEIHHNKHKLEFLPEVRDQNTGKTDQKKVDSDKKRMESLKKKRQEFKEKQMIIKTGLIGIDKVQNKKVLFSDDDDAPRPKLDKPKFPHVKENKESKDTDKHPRKKTLFDDNDDSGDEPNFEIKKQFEGMKGQKVLDLQSRYKSDKRFILDEKFIENDSDGEKELHEGVTEDEQIELGAEDEKAKQLHILQDVLGVAIKSKSTEPINNKKAKVTKLGMLRFDPSQPQHAKFLAPVEEKQEKKAKKKKKENIEEAKPVEPEVPKVEVSKEQFYKVSDTLKEAIAQPTTFSLRSLFGNNEEESNKDGEQPANYIPLQTTKEKKKKVKNPMEPGEKNPFVYDSSESENEGEEETKLKPVPLSEEPVKQESKAVWKENLFFSDTDYRLEEGLAFFNKPNKNEVQKERRELKYLMKKRIYNKERKNQMFQKKIGGRKKTMKKSYKKKEVSKVK